MLECLNYMFEVPKPRQFHYTPRFYDPEKERWEALKKKYADEHPDIAESTDEANAEEGADLAYFEERVRQLDRAKRQQPKPLGWRDLFRKRPMPEFHYTPRFNTDGTVVETATGTDTAQSAPARRPIKIRRRFNIDDENYLKPVSGGKIILYCFLVCLLLYWVFF